MPVSVPRLVVSAPASGGGKTTVTCGLLRAFQRRGLRLQACKCGPDYIDPLFHERVIGVPSRNLDLFVSSAEDVCRLLAGVPDGAVGATQPAGDPAGRASGPVDLTIVEGVMGYYDGVAVSDQASSWDLARTTQSPTILVVDCRGRARSLAAEVLGFLRLREPSCIRGIILNRVSQMMYPQLKALIEEETGVSVLGFLPRLDDCSLKSRHLGLVGADEVEDLQARLDRLADAMEQTVDLDGLLDLARMAPALDPAPRQLDPVASPGCPVRIALARDLAFCFYYADGLGTLESLGAELVPFSPLTDGQLPADIDGLYLGGGYPELHASQLEANVSLRQQIAGQVAAGLPTVAECGGFMYLQESIEDMEGRPHQMVGLLPGRAYKTDHLRRFGYVTMEASKDGLLAEAGQTLRAHGLHYWDSEAPGEDFHAQKPQSRRSWDCCVTTPTLYAGYPHLNFYSEPVAARRFVEACLHHRDARLAASAGTRADSAAGSARPVAASPDTEGGAR